MLRRRPTPARRLRAATLGLVVVALTATSAAAADGPHLLSGSRLSLSFASLAGFPANNNDRLDAVVWKDSAGVATANLVAAGGSTCGDVVETWGQAYGFPEGTQPLPVVAGTRSTWTGTATSGTAKVTGQTCFGAQPVATTSYAVYPGAGDVRRNAFRVSRSIAFGATPVLYDGSGIRFYVPRIPLAVYPTLLYPSPTGLKTVFVPNCSVDCVVTDWKGGWFADDSAGGAGRGLLVMRDLGSRAPALLTANNDGFSASNLSSVVLLEPAAGWRGTVTETQWLCFYDTASWPVASRATTRPTGCAIPPGAPRSLVVTPGASRLTAAFLAPADAGGRPVTAYTMTVTPTGGGTTRTATGPAGPLTVAGLVPGRSYTVVVTATTASGVGAAVRTSATAG